MKALLYLVLMLGSLLGGTAQVLASDVLLAETVLDKQQGDDHRLNEHKTLPDLPPLPSDNEPRLVAAETVVASSFQAVPVELSLSSFLSSASASSYPIRAPPPLAL